MAAGDITAVVIRDATPINTIDGNGWVIDVTIEGLGVGGTYNAAAIAASTFTSTVPGHDETGAPIAIPGIVTPLLAPLRKPMYPTWAATTLFTQATRGFMSGGTATDIRCTWLGRIYKATAGTTYPTTGTNPPIHTSGTVSDGGVAWTFIAIAYDLTAADIEMAQVASGGNVTVSFVSNDFHYASDTMTAISLAANLYTQGGNASNATTALGLLTKSSTRLYPPPLGVWNIRGWQQVPGAFAPEFAATHRYVQGNRTLACLKYNYRDSAGTIVAGGTRTITAMIDSTSLTLGNPVPVYADAFDIGADGFYTVDAECYPWRGDVTFKTNAAASATNKTGFGKAAGTLTSADSLHYNTPKCIPFRRGSIWTYAFVDGIGAAPAASADPAMAETTPYATIDAAAIGVQSFNNSTYGRNDTGRSIINIMAGVTTAGFGGANMNSRAKGDVALIVQRAPSAAVGTAGFGYTATASHRTPTKRMVLRNLRMVNSTASAPLITATDGISAWVAGVGFTGEIECEDCDFTGVSGVALGTQPMTSSGLTGFVNCLFPAYTVTVGASSGRTIVRSFNGCVMDAGAGQFAGISHLGTIYNGASRPAGSIGSANLEDPVDGIDAANRKVDVFFALNMSALARSQTVKVPGDATKTFASGAVIEQSLFEAIGATKGIEFFGDLTLGAIDNVIFRYNSIPGEGLNYLYNENGFSKRAGLSSYNAMDDNNVKADWYSSGSYYADATRIGNMEVRYAIGHEGNVILAGTDGVAAPRNNMGEAFPASFRVGTTVAPLVRGWTDDRSKSGTNTGYGSYLPTAASATIGAVPAGKHGYPIDLAGRPRATTTASAAGAYEGPKSIDIAASILGGGFMSFGLAKSVTATVVASAGGAAQAALGKAGQFTFTAAGGGRLGLSLVHAASFSAVSGAGGSLAVELAASSFGIFDIDVPASRIIRIDD